MKRRLLSLLMVTCVAASIVGCSSGKGNGDGSVKIQFMHSSIEEDRQAVIEEIIKDFESKNPNIDVEQVPVDEDSYNTKITALGGSGQLPAVMELGIDFAKSTAKNQFIDLDAHKEVITDSGEDNFYSKVLDVIRTEDGSNYTGVPMSGWVQGIWYDKKAFEEKGLNAPETWEDIMKAAKAFYDKDNRKYGIATSTADSGFTEQVFSQFALSNGANVFDENGKAVFNSPEMKEAVEYYKELASYTMPGSNDVTQVKDAFLNGSVPMAMYSTYILPAVHEMGIGDKIGFAVPKNKEKSAFGTVTVMGISEGLKDEERDAAKKFVSHLITDEANTKWLHMSPGGAQPVLKSVAESEAYLSNEVIKSFEGIATEVADAFNELRLFGTVGEKNFLSMGDVSSKGIIGKAINDIIVNNKDVEATINSAQTEIEKTIE